MKNIKMKKLALAMACTGCSVFAFAAGTSTDDHAGQAHENTQVTGQQETRGTTGQATGAMGQEPTSTEGMGNEGFSEAGPPPAGNPEANEQEVGVQQPGEQQMEAEDRFSIHQETVRFEEGSADLSSEAEGELAELADAIEKDKPTSVTLLTEQQIGATTGEMEQESVSSERAQKVRQFLMDQDINVTEWNIDGAIERTSDVATETPATDQQHIVISIASEGDDGYSVVTPE